MYNSIDNVDYLVGVIHFYTNAIDPYFTFKYSDEWLNYPYAYSLNSELPLRKKVTRVSIRVNFLNFIRYCYTNEIDYFYEFYIIYAIKNNLIGRNATNLERLYNWFKTETSEGAKFAYRHDKYKIIPYTVNMLNQNDFTRCGSIRLKSEIDGDFCKCMSPSLIPKIDDISNIINIINKIKNNTETSQELEQFVACASSLNGFQPKFNIYNESGNLCIAKLSSIFKNDFNEMKREILALNLDKKTGINVQNYSIRKTKNNEKYILVERFDRIENKRIPFMYFTDFTKRRSIYDNDIKITKIIKNICKDNYKYNLKEMFKRKLFRTVVGNLKDLFANTAFLFDTQNGWNLSPEFDINCGYRRYYTKEQLEELYPEKLAFRRQVIQNLIDNANLYFISKNDIIEILEQFKYAMLNWQQEAINVGFKEDELFRLKIYEEALYNLNI